MSLPKVGEIWHNAFSLYYFIEKVVMSDRLDGSREPGIYFSYLGQVPVESQRSGFMFLSSFYRNKRIS